MAEGCAWPPRQRESAAPTLNPQGSLRIRRPWPLQSMAANGRRQNRRQQMEPGPARAGSARQSIRKQVLRIRRTQPLQFMAAGFVFYPAVATGSRPCRPAAASGCRHCRPAASGAGHCPARKLQDCAIKWKNQRLQSKGNADIIEAWKFVHAEKAINTRKESF